MNLALEKRKQELANQYIDDPEQKEIFLKQHVTVCGLITLRALSSTARNTRNSMLQISGEN